MKKSIQKLREKKSLNEKFSVITAYDSSIAEAAVLANIDAILVGDSLGMVVQGKESTVPVCIDDMVYHTQTVVNGRNAAVRKNKDCDSLIIADLPFMSYYNKELALENSAKLMQAGANMVKLEGGEWLKDITKALVENGIPVCAHLGLTPQSVNKLGGYRIQGKTENQQKQLIEDAKTLESYGADFVVLECIPSSLAKEVTSILDMSTIGIGAGKSTDAQVLVCYDLLGLGDKHARFVKNFLTAENITSSNPIRDAFSAYDLAVKNGDYPSSEHEYTI